ncbi:rhodanese-like domain-containing protein [Rhodococcoides yunnanense]|uniref:rhodanese-like domain-containing protein n=1 Tax=Rhodococcoides yunnanense TaxID=278209 RepID=UPI0009350540|nr:rhodanese-like domain-containing protein [Rhodococcus yunnanensis]
MTSTLSSTIDAAALHTLLTSAEEYALIDVREPRITAEHGSILLGVSLPASALELRVDALIPRRSTAVVVYDGGDDELADRSARRLRELGYTNVRVLTGGLRAWSEAGFKVQTGGEHVIGQAFGEWIEEIYQTPHISVPEFLKKVDAGEDVVLLDSRPIGEFENHSLPGGTSIPGAELVYRAGEVVTSPDTLVVVNCAGRTRSILGAQVLINAGLQNRVVSLEGGTQSWVLEGHQLVHDTSSAAPLPTGSSLESAKAAAARIAERFGVRTIDSATLRSFEENRDERSLYLLDVRTPEEFESGHLPGSLSAPSWDVAPWVFRYIAVHNSRIVLIDNDLVRATVAASWIVQFGWGEVFVLEDALSDADLNTGPVARTVLGVVDDGYSSIDPTALNTELGTAEVTVIDLQPSPSYVAGHIPGSVFAIRSRLAQSVSEISGAGAITLTSTDGVLARLAATELSAVTSRPIRVLDGGTDAWTKAGFALDTENASWLHAGDDVVRSGWRETDPEERKAGFRRYLSWELGLVAELSEDDTVPFKSFN